jgi:AraC family transcriptional regulator
MDKQFLIGLEPSPPPNHIWQEYAGYSIYSAEQDPSLWSHHSHDCTQIAIASSPAYVRAEWQADAGRRGTKEMNGDMVSVIPPGVQHNIHWKRRAQLLIIYLNDQFFDSVLENVPNKISTKLAPSLLVRDPFLVEMGKELGRELQFGPINELFTKSVATLTATHLIRAYSCKPSSGTGYRGGSGPSREITVCKYIQDNLDAAQRESAPRMEIRTGRAERRSGRGEPHAARHSWLQQGDIGGSLQPCSL